MKIAINLAAVRTPGTKNYMHGFLGALVKIALKDEFLVFLPRQELDSVQSKVSRNIHVRATECGKEVSSRLIWEQFVLPSVLKAWKVDVLLAPFDIAPLVSEAVVLGIRNPTSLLLKMGLADMTLASRIRARIHFCMSRLSCRRATVVFYPSHYAAVELGTIMGVSPAKRRVVYHGVDHEYWRNNKSDPSVLRKYRVEAGRFYLFVSSFYPYKHPECMVDALRRLKQIFPSCNHRVVLVGGYPDKNVEDLVWRRIWEKGLIDEVILAGTVPRSDLATLYRTCTAMVLPTTMETFGQPFVEAMACGAVVICSDMPFTREICGEAAWYFPPMDIDGLARAMLRAVEDRPGAELLRQCGPFQSDRYGWEREVSETLELLHFAGQSE